MTFSRRSRAKTHGCSCIGNLAQAAGWLDGSRVRREFSRPVLGEAEGESPSAYSPDRAGVGERQDRHRPALDLSSATTSRSAAPGRPPRSSTTRATGGASIRRRTSPATPAFCRRTPTTATTSSISRTGSPAPIREAACWEDPATRATSAGRRCLRMSAGGGRMSGPRIRDRPSRRRERKMQRFKSARSA